MTAFIASHRVRREWAPEFIIAGTNGFCGCGHSKPMEAPWKRLPERGSGSFHSHASVIDFSYSRPIRRLNSGDQAGLDVSLDFHKVSF
jgi:hypothetical protein